MRNMLLALAGIAAITFSSTAVADDSVSVVENTAEIQVQPIADAPAPMPIAAEEAVSMEAAAPVAVSAAPCCCCQNKAKKKQNVFAKLLELERKKNAWLRRTFFGK